MQAFSRRPSPSRTYGVPCSLTAFAILTDGLVYAAYLFIVAIGLTLIFGVMKILNVTHGSFYAFGAYGAATAVGIYSSRLAGGAAASCSWCCWRWRSASCSALVLERGILRLVYGKDEVVIVLVTYAAFLILEDVIVLIWGPRSYAAYQPMVAAGNIEVGDLVLSNYDIGLVALAAALAALAYWALKFTRYGRLLTVVIFDRETAAAFGINVTLVYTVTFVIGAMLGALGGAVMAPKISVTLGIGVEVIVLAFAVVAIGGMGSIEGALVGALIVGICRAAAVHLVPQIELFVIYAVMALVLVVPALRPVRARPAEEDLTWSRAQHLVGALLFLVRRGGRPARCRTWLVSLATIAFANALVVLGLVMLWRAGLVLVRPGALLLHRRLRGGADRPLDRLHRRVRAGAARRRRRPASSRAWSASCSRATAKSSSRC